MSGNLQKSIEITQGKHEPSRELLIPEPLNSDEIAVLLSEMYSITSPRIGAILVEANYVLTLAGVRGQTEFFIENPTPKDEVTIERLVIAMKSKAILLRAGSVMERPQKKPLLMVSIENGFYNHINTLLCAKGYKTRYFC